MTIGTRAQLFQARTFRSVRRPGLVADLAVGTVVLYNVSGVVAVHYMFGVCTDGAGAGAALPQLHFRPTVGAAQVDLSGPMATIAAMATGAVIQWNGLLAGVPAPFAVLGIADNTINWGGGFITLAAGDIEISNAGPASAGSIIDWYVLYLPQIAGSLITAA